jgi:amino acid adenylation domain-containing protein
LLELESQENPVSISASNHLAYIIYTSGSTGTPKGVLGTHQGTVNGLHWLWKTYPFTNGEVCCQKTAISFVDSVWEIFAPLLQGIPTIIIPDGIVLNSQLFIETLAYYKVTRIILVPSLLRLLLDNYPHLMQNLSHLKLWITSGEALSVNLARTFRELMPSAKLLNFYGSSEVSANVTYYDTSLLPERANSVPIGRPIDNILVYILDRYLQPTPIGVIGELYIGGDGLARGYLNQPALTSEKFIPNPFGDCPGTHLYKTGDLACYLSNGEIQYIGRIDHQVKIRGFRIELGEIEAAINQHPEIQQAVVLAQEDQTGNKQLVAYVVASSQNHHSQEKLYRELIPQLRSFLESNLPNYMVPAAFVILEVLSLTPNGKIDRQALSTTDTTQIFSKSDFIPAATPIEQMLALIWEKVLSTEKIGIHDNFFELGGHSLLATRVISQVRQVFQQELPLHSLFAQPTIAGLAKEIEKATKLDLGLETATIARVSHEQELPLSFAQKRLWFLVQLNPNSSLYNSSAAIRLEGQLNQAALQQSFNEIIRRHQALRTTFPVVNGQPIQVISPSATLKLPIVDLQELPEAQKKALVQKLIQEESQRCFDLVQCPLLRYTLIHTHELEYILLFTIHHIVSDGWSVGVLIKELTTLYKDFCAEQPSSLPELPIQYADFAIWQRQWLQGEVLEAQLAYWKRQLGNNLPVLQLPTTRPRAEVKTNHGSTSSFIIPIKESESLQALSRQEGVTLFMTLLAAFQILLQRYTHQDDIVVGTDIANRNRAEIEPLIGFFVNLLVLRTDLSGNPSFPELLKRVRSCTLGAYAHQDLPFEELVKALEPDRNLSNIPPLFQVLFVLQNAPIPPLELTGLTLSLLEVENKVAKFDLALFLTETESGILGKWQYNSDLFDTPTITRITGHFQTLINSIVSQPDSRINSLEMITEEERKQQAMQKRERKASNREKFISIVPQAISLSQAGLIKTTYLQPEQIFPLVIQPNTDDIDLVNWVQNNRAFLEKQLLKHGAILFRDFNINSVPEFESFAQAIYPDLFDEYGDLPRTEEGGKVYGSTPYPSDKAILFHNESSHLYQFPLKIWFFCVQPAKQGGETPIVDCRKAYQILNHNLRERLIEKQLMYIRHYTDGLDVSWQSFFRTNDKSLVENYCRRTEIDFEWYDNNSLMTRQVLPAVAIHPKSNDMVFFNQIQLHHIAYLDAEVRESLLSLFGDKQLPRNVCYGDGTPIEDDVISEINQVYQQSKTSFPWQQQDILMLDNMLAAHGRYPYIGERKIVVAMGEMIQSKDIVLQSKAGGGK